MFKLRTIYSVLLLLTLAAGCTSPDLSGQISDSLTLITSSKDASKSSLIAASKEELEIAERSKAEANQRIVDLPTGCIIAFADLSLSVDHCTVRALASPVDGAVNATQVLLAYKSLENYFAALQSLAQSTDPADIEAKSKRLLSAIGDFADANDSASLDRLQSKIANRSDVVSSTVGFLAKQARQRALRNVMLKADPVIEKLVAGMQPKILTEGDAVDVKRTAALVAFEAYNTAHLEKNPTAQVATAKQLRVAIKEMHEQEKVSPLRKLYLARALHGAMLSRLTRTQNFDDVEALLIEITDILIALEDK